MTVEQLSNVRKTAQKDSRLLALEEVVVVVSVGGGGHAKDVRRLVALNGVEND